jgi:hypothetical protein
MKKAILWINIILISVVVFSGCSKKKDDPNPTGVKEKNMKFTITATGLLATDEIIMPIIGADVGGLAQTLFKLNGVTQNNQRGFSITKEQLRAGKVVIETATPIFSTVIGIGGSSETANHTFSIKIEAEIGGKAQPVLNKTLTTATYSESFTYTADQ